MCSPETALEPVEESLIPKEKIPIYYQTYPPDLATIEALKLEGRQPADGQGVAALFKLRIGDREHLCDLCRRSEAVLLQIRENT
ncbi:hypothetical protein [Deinococcus sp. QL22]|uniref:hypothetical protein n=1 Tax=Deinococcus sp. QL22 TaxID=2939437 RepID=UPI0020183460|nr:hypothetical protein [Deinococcus sp. QL22]UQN10109.1 hypothetical protein M1R55_28375 [Deinococcus sp. QL22]